MVLVAGAEVVGYAVTMRAGDVVDLQRIAVRPDRQRQGLAALLLADVARRGPAPTAPTGCCSR